MSTASAARPENEKFSKSRWLVISLIPACLFQLYLPGAYHLAYVLLGTVAALAFLRGRADPLIQGRSAAQRVGLIALAMLAVWLFASYVFTDSTGSSATRQSVLVGYEVGFLLSLLVAICYPLSDLLLLRAISLASVGAFLLGLLSPPGFDGRSYALGQNPNGLGLIEAVGLTALVTLAVRFGSKIAWIGVILGTFALAGTNSRGSLLSAAVGIGWCLISSSRGWHRWLIAAALSVGVAAAPLMAGALQHFFLGQRTSAEMGDVGAIRGNVAATAIEVANSHPLGGVGLGNFSSVTTMLTGVHENIASHNEYLGLAAECGYVGFILIVVLAFCSIVGAKQIAPDLVAVVLAYWVGLLSGNELANLTVSVSALIAVGVTFSRRPTKFAFIGPT